jgi:predicted transcriptional regulator
LNEHYGFVMMTKEKYWVQFRERNRQGKETHSFVLRGTAPPKDTRILLFHVTKPVSALDGYAEFIERKVGSPEEVWNEHGNESVLQTKHEFEEFIGNPQHVSFVRFKNLTTANNPIPLSNFLQFRGAKRLSRRGFYVDKSSCERLISAMK